MKNVLNNNRDYFNSKNIINIFSSLTAVTLSITYWICRLGFENNSIYPVIKTLGICLFIIFLSEFIRLIVYRYENQDSIFLSDSFISFTGITGIILCGFFISIIKVNLCFIFVILGYFFFMAGIYNFVRNREKIKIVYIIAGFLFALYIAGIIWGSGYHNPLFVELIVVASPPSIDTLFHANLTNIIKTYGIPSTGLDGLIYLPTHYGSHWIFAQLSKLLEIPPIIFYQLAYPVIFIPFLLKNIMSFSIEVKKYMNLKIHLDFFFLIIFLIAFIGFLPKNISVYSSIWYWNIFISESYSLAFLFSFILFSLLIIFLRNVSLQNITTNKKEYVFLYFLLPLFIGIIGFLKISLMFLWFIVYVYLFLRLGLYKNIKFSVSFFNSSLLFFIVYYMAKATVETPLRINNILSFFYFISSCANDGYFIYYFFGHYFWSWTLIYLLFCHKNIITLLDLKNSFLRREIIYLEIIGLLCIFGALPGIIVLLPYGAAGSFYFSDIQSWVSLGILLGILSVFLQDWDQSKEKFIKSFREIRNIKIINIFIILIVFISLISFLFNFINPIKSFLEEQIKFRKKILIYCDENYNQKEFLLNVIETKNFLKIKDGINYIISAPQKALEKNKNYQLLKLFEELEKLPLKEKKETLIYIPKTNNLYWNLLYKPDIKEEEWKNFYGKASSFVAPAITGIAMIDGLPPVELCKEKYFGYVVYEFSNTEQLELNREELCHRVLDKGFSKVIIIDFINGEIVKKEIICKDFLQ